MTASHRAVAMSALSLAVALGCGRTQSSPTPPPVSANAPAPVDGHIDPAPYRAEIETTEALLYSGESLADADWKGLSRALLELHNAIVFRDKTPAARETSRRLFFFSAQVDAETAVKHGDAELEVMRRVWEQIRAEQFATADWFHTASR
jgi:hypothetical protein